MLLFGTFIDTPILLILVMHYMNSKASRMAGPSPDTSPSTGRQRLSKQSSQSVSTRNLRDSMWLQADSFIADKSKRLAGLMDEFNYYGGDDQEAIKSIVEQSVEYVDMSSNGD